jgi:acyl-CoA synthetase (AMP-forming)/AMP-acid ligase II
VNVVDLLRDSDRPAIIAPDGSTVSFTELRQRVGAFAGGLIDLGLRAGDRVVLLVPMSIELYVALLALFHVGATAVLIDPSAPISAILTRFAPVAMIGSSKAHLLRFTLRPLRGLGLYVSTGFIPLPHRRLSRIQGVVPPVDSGEHPALLTFTTGSTGTPKAIARSHEFLLTQHRILAEHLRLGPGDVDMPTLPVFLLHSLASGATCVLADADLRNPGAVDPDRVIAQVRAVGVTSISGSPAFFAPLARRLLERGETLPGLKHLHTGGARVPVGMLKALCEAAPEAEIAIVYGSTEAEPIAVLSVRENLAVLEDGERSGKGALVGPPVRQLAVRIDDDEILVAGPHVNPGYYQDPEADAENKVREGGRLWHRTGDAGYLDDAGRIWLVGRAGGRIGGVWPMQVEAPAELLGFVVKAGLAAVDGEAVLACEVVDAPEGWEAEVAAVVGVRVVRVDVVPVDPRHNAKVDRKRLETMLRDE